MQHIVSYTPQQNGVVERNNCTLKETTNCMIQYKGLSLNYWEEYIKCALYIVNLTTKKDLKSRTPKESWNKINPKVSHFHLFGSVSTSSHS